MFTASSFIENAWYSQKTETLTLEIRGQKYQYENVPPLVWEEFCSAESKGSFFNKRIRNQFPLQGNP